MLINLKIENVAVIEQSEILFDSGLNVLTGETGAGKSIVIDAINAILGERTSKQLIRDGADKAKISAVFENIPYIVRQKLTEYEIESDDDSLLITRIITSDGRNSCKVNGESVTVSMLRNIGRDLITICGQHDSQYLLQKESHLSFVDTMASCDELKEQYRELYYECKKINKELSKLMKHEGDKEKQLEFLKFQIDEITNADIVVGEKENLLNEKKRFQNKEKIAQALNNAQYILNGDEAFSGVLSGIYNLTDCLSTLSDYDEKYSEYIDNLENLRYTLDECSNEISRSVSDGDDEYVDIDFIESRLDVLYKLSRKYGSTEEEILLYLDKITEEYESINSADEMIEQLTQQLQLTREKLLQAGCYLSDSRKIAATDFENRVCRELRFLDMPDAVFEVSFTDCEISENGIDEVEFLFSANKGQAPKPLSKIASGGELSRVMLAIRCVLSGDEMESTLIFDEIDTGVSGRAAHKIAYKLRELSQSKQVICVTHLAQIASCANSHLFIEKVTDENSTYTKVTNLDDEQKIKEIARIIGGDVITQTTLNSAKEMIEFSLNADII